MIEKSKSVINLTPLNLNQERAISVFDQQKPQEFKSIEKYSSLQQKQIENTQSEIYP